MDFALVPSSGGAVSFFRNVGTASLPIFVQLNGVDNPLQWLNKAGMLVTNAYRHVHLFNTASNNSLDFSAVTDFDVKMSWTTDTSWLGANAGHCNNGNVAACTVEICGLSYMDGDQRCNPKMALTFKKYKNSLSGHQLYLHAQSSDLDEYASASYSTFYGARTAKSRTTLADLNGDGVSLIK